MSSVELFRMASGRDCDRAPLEGAAITEGLSMRATTVNVTNGRTLLRLPNKEPQSKRVAVVGPVRRTTRYMIHTYGKDGKLRRTWSKIYGNLAVAKEAARQLVESGRADHCFVLHIVESAKLVSDQSDGP